MNISPITIDELEPHVFRFSFVTQGVTGEQWIEFFYSSKILVTTGLKNHFRSSFVPTNGVTHTMLVIGGKALDASYLNYAVGQKTKRTATDVTIEGMCLAHAGLTEESWRKMRLEQIVGIREPVQGLDSSGSPGLPVIRAPWNNSHFFGLECEHDEFFCRATGFAYFK